MSGWGIMLRSSRQEFCQRSGCTHKNNILSLDPGHAHVFRGWGRQGVWAGLYILKHNGNAHPCLPAAPSDLGGLALVTGNKFVVTQEARAFSFTPEFSKDGWRVFKNTIPRKGCGEVDIKSTSFTVSKLLLAALIFRNRIFLWETGDFRQ